MFEKARARALKKETSWICTNKSLQESLGNLPDWADVPSYKRRWRRTLAQQLGFFARDNCALSDPVYGHMRRHLLKMRYKNA